MGKRYLELVEQVSCFWIRRCCCHITSHFSHVFGTRYSASDDEQDREPSTADLLRQKRATRKEKQREAQRPQGRVESLGFSLRLPLFSSLNMPLTKLI